MIDPRTIVDILLEDGGDDLEAFVKGSGVLTPGASVAERWQAAYQQKQAELANPNPNQGGKDWFYTEGLRYGDGEYAVHTSLPKQAAYCQVTATLPKHIQNSFNIYDQMQTAEFRRNIRVPMDAESVRKGIDRLYAWTIKEMQKWADLAYCRRMFKKLAPNTGKQVGNEFRSVFKDHRAFAGYENNGYVKSSVPNKVAAQMAAWMRARVAQLGIRESEEPGLGIDMDKFLRDAGVTVQPDDFIMDGRQIGAPGMWTGNYRYSIYYKRLLHKGRPVYLGSITGCHDYNRTGHAGLVHYYVDVPRRTWKYDPRDSKGRRIYKEPKFRSNFGHGAVHMNPPPQSTSVGSLFEGAKLLLSLLKIQHPLKQAESLEEAADAGLLDELGSLATDPILIPSKVKVDFLSMDQHSGDFYFTVSLLRSRHSYRHFLGTLKRSHTGEWFIEDMPEVVLRKRVEPYPNPDEAFPTDLAAERALIKHIIRQFPGLLTPRW